MKSSSIIFLILIIGCINICLGDEECEHGVWQNQLCVCDTDWIGDDCSIPYQILSFGEQPIEGEVEYREWAYFYVTIPSQFDTRADLIWRVAQIDPDSSVDIDEYLSHGDDLPDRRQYDFRDITTRDEVTMKVEHAAAGRWTLGCYGFQPGHFTVSVELVTECENNCNDNGRCEQGACVCFDGFAGEFCDQVFYHNAQFDTPYVGEIGYAEWQYFQVDFTQYDPVPDRLIASLERTSSDGDIDLYGRYGGQLPSYFNADYWDVSTGTHLELVLDNIFPDVYIFGLYGFSGGSYEFTLTISGDGIQCTNRCSLRGECDRGTCGCSQGFSGGACEQLTSSMHTDTLYTGWSGINSWNWYHIHSSSENTLRVQLTMMDEPESGTPVDQQHCSVFVQADGRPSRFQYDFEMHLHADTSNQQILDIIHPFEANLWYIGVYGDMEMPCYHTIQAFETNECECGPSHNGWCPPNTSECNCSNGFAGIDCETPVTMIQSNVPVVNAHTEEYVWHYYEMTISARTSFVSVVLEEHPTVFEQGQVEPTTGLLWLFVDETGDFPTLEDYDKSALEPNTSLHKITLDHEAQPLERGASIFIGVYGNPYNEHGQTIEYSIVAWQSPF